MKIQPVLYLFRFFIFLFFSLTWFSCNPCYLEETPLKTVLHCGGKSVVISPAIPGPPGEKGEPGTTGDSCSIKTTTTEPSGDQKLVLICGNKEHSITIPKGEQGAQGEKGETGNQGEPGKDGNPCSITKSYVNDFGDQVITIQCGNNKVELVVPKNKYNRQHIEFRTPASRITGTGGLLYRRLNFNKTNAKSDLRVSYFSDLRFLDISLKVRS